jgi:hypothetical protein
MVIAYHLIWMAYGFWLPNDVRGSTSRILRNDLLKELDEIHFGRKKFQPRPIQFREFMDRAKIFLEFPLLEFHTPDVDAIAKSLIRETASDV